LKAEKCRWAPPALSALLAKYNRAVIPHTWLVRRAP
jgi:hypothetical protein